MSCNEWCSSKNEGQVQRFKSCSDRWDAPRRKRSIIADICHSAMNPFNDASIDRSTSGLIKAPLVLIDHYAFTQSLFTADSWWTIFAFFYYSHQWKIVHRRDDIVRYSEQIRYDRSNNKPQCDNKWNSLCEDFLLVSAKKSPQYNCMCYEVSSCCLLCSQM